jgi:translation initiation factor eIF-2B subunit gamma
MSSVLIATVIACPDNKLCFSHFRDVPLHPHSAATPWQPVAGFQKKELSVIGDACEMGDKVTVKQCAVGKGCTIGAKSKLNNCVIMDNVTIGER